MDIYLDLFYKLLFDTKSFLYKCISNKSGTLKPLATKRQSKKMYLTKQPMVARTRSVLSIAIVSHFYFLYIV